MTTTASTTSTAVTLVSAIRLQAGAEASHRQLHDRAVAHAATLGGLQRAERVPALEDVQPDTVALLTFADRPALDRWLSDATRAELLARMDHLAESARTLTVLGGFAGWFAAAAPPRWKQASTVLLALIPLALVTALLRQALLPGLPLAAAVALLSTLNVLCLTYGLMPVLTRALAGWLTSVPTPPGVLR